MEKSLPTSRMLPFSDRTAQSDPRPLPALTFDEPTLSVHTADLRAPSAQWLASRIGFAPGMAAMLAGLGRDTAAVLVRLVTDLEARHGTGALSLRGKAFVGTAMVPARGKL